MGYMDSTLPGLAPVASAQSAQSLGTIAGSAAGALNFNPITAGVGLLGSAASTYFANKAAKTNQRDAFEQQKWMMQNRYQMQTRDLKAAGLNPMLAVTQGAPMPGSVGQAPVQKVEAINEMSQAMLSSAQAQKTVQETENLKIENSNLRDTGLLLQKQWFKTQSEIDEIDQRAKTGKASETEITRRAELIEIQKELMRVQILLGRQEWGIKRPEQIASGTQAAEISATIERALAPLIKMLGGAAQAVK